jgi:hypothetical protein
VLEHASEEMKNNAAVVTVTVQQSGLALLHASRDMKNNATIVTARSQQS